MSDSLPSDLVKHILSFCDLLVAFRITLCCHTTNLSFLCGALVKLCIVQNKGKVYERLVRHLIHQICDENNVEPCFVRRLQIDDNYLMTAQELQRLSDRLSNVTALELEGSGSRYPLSNICRGSITELIIGKLIQPRPTCDKLSFLYSTSPLHNLRVLGVDQSWAKFAFDVLTLHPLPSLVKLVAKIRSVDSFDVDLLSTVCKAHKPHLKLLKFHLSASASTSFWTRAFGYTYLNDILKDLHIEETVLDRYGVELRNITCRTSCTISVWASIVSTYAIFVPIENFERLRTLCHPGAAKIEKDLCYVFGSLFSGKPRTQFLEEASLKCSFRLLTRAAGDFSRHTASSIKYLAPAVANFANAMLNNCQNHDIGDKVIHFRRRVTPSLKILQKLIELNPIVAFHSLTRLKLLDVIEELLKKKKWFSTRCGIDLNAPMPFPEGDRNLAFLLVEKRRKGLTHLLEMPSYNPICFLSKSETLLKTLLDRSFRFPSGARLILAHLDTYEEGRNHLKEVLHLEFDESHSRVAKHVWALVRSKFGTRYDK